MARILVNLLQSTGTKGGIEVYVRELYTQLGRMEPEHEFVGYASTELATSGAPWFPGEVINSGISGENRFTWAFGELFRVSRAARRVRADLIHGPAMFAPLRSSIPVIVTFHDLLYFSHPELMQTRLFTRPVRWMERRAARTSSRVITISEYSASMIRRHFHYPADRIDVIPLAGRDNTLGRARFGPRADDLFLSIGQRSPYKDFETVVRAWALIPESTRPRLVITGSHGQDPLLPLVEQLGLGPWVQLKSWIDTEELVELFGTATALIDSTLATGFSMPTLEAMSVGLPVLLADTEVFREVGGDAAEYFGAGDPASLALAVQELSAQPARRIALAARGEARAANYSWERVARETLASFEHVLTVR